MTLYFLSITLFVVLLLSVENSFGLIHGCNTDGASQPVCSQLCKATEVAIQCSCKAGYLLANNNRTCVVAGEEPKLVLVSENTLFLYHVESSHLEPYLKYDSMLVTNIGFGPQNSVFWIGNNGTVVYRASLNKSDMDKVTDISSVIDTGLGYVTSLAIDWVTSNMYLVDNKAGTIIVCDTKGDNCAVLVRNLERPYSIIIDIELRGLLWTQWGTGNSSGSINRAELDGSRQFVFIKALQYPRGLVLDRTVSKLYWIVGAEDGDIVIQSANVQGQNIKVIRSSKYYNPLVSVLTDHLYIADRDRLTLVNKYTGSVLSDNSLDTGNISAAAMYHPVLFDAGNITNPCVSSPCSHLCVPSNSERGYQCMCPEDMVLASDVLCQNENSTEVLLVSGVSGMYKVPVDFIGYHGSRGRSILQGDINSLVYDAVRGRIIYHDDKLQAIRVVDINNTGLQSTLYNKVLTLEDLTYDGTSRVIYWSTNKGEVYAGKDDGSFSTVIISQLDRPRGITLSAETGYMYICDWGKVPRILQCHMDGSNCETFVDVTGGHPNMVVIATPISMQAGMSGDQERTLYWSDSKLDQIGYVNLDNTSSRGFIQLNHTQESHPYGLIVTNTTIYFTDLNTRQVHLLEKTNLTQVQDLRLETGMLLGLDHVQKDSWVAVSACTINNGGCTYMCLPKPNTQRTCFCPPDVDKDLCSESTPVPLDVTMTIEHRKPDVQLELTSTPTSRQVNTPASKQVSTHNSKQVSTPASKQVSTLTSNQVSTPTSNQVSTKTSNQVSTPTSNQVSTQTSNQVSTPTSNQVSTQTSNQVSTPTSNQVSTQTSNQVSTPTSNQVSTQTSNQVSTQTSNQVSTPTSNQVSTQTSNQVSTPTSQQISTQTSNQVSTQTSNQVSTPTSQQISAQTSNQVSTLTSKQYSTPTSKPVSTSTSQQVSTPTSKQVSTPTSKQVSTSTSQQVSTPTSKQVSTPTSKQVSTSTNKQVSTSTSKQVSTPTSKQVSTSTSKQVSTMTSKQYSTQTSKQVSTPTSKQISSLLETVTEVSCHQGSVCSNNTSPQPGPLDDSETMENRKPDELSEPSSKQDSTPLVAVIAITLSVVIVVIVGIVGICVLKHKELKHRWNVKLVRYSKTKQGDDVEGLVSDSSSTLSDFKQFDDLNYPEDGFSLGQRRHSGNGREMSMISTDSAFTEMRDFDGTYCSIDTLSK